MNRTWDSALLVRMGLPDLAPKPLELKLEGAFAFFF